METVAEWVDENGTRWTKDSYSTADGSRGETFGPGHPRPPEKVVLLRQAAVEIDTEASCPS
jgi:hypothetical protein